MTGRRGIDTVLFDVGNTLLDFDSLDPRPFLGEGFRLGHDYLASLGHALPPPPTYANRMRRKMLWRFLRSRLTRREMRLHEALVTVHARLGIVLDSDTAAELGWRICLPMRRVGHAAPGARAALTLLRDRGYKLGIISNTATPPTALDRHLREEENLLEFFAVRVYSCEVRYMKPDRRIFEIAVRRIGSSAANTAYVGDSVGFDVHGAGRAGMLTVLKAPDGSHPDGRWKADHVIKTLAELPGVLESYPRPCPAS